jgi:hypothetical protein
MAVDGYLNLAGPTFTFQIRWGTVNSTTSAEQNFPFSTSFTNNCFGVVGNWKDANQNNGFWVKDWDKDGFNIDRWDGESGTKVYTYLAWGS